MSIATINLFSGEADWVARRGLMLAELQELAADVVAVQEVSLTKTDAADPAEWLAARSGYTQLKLCRKTGSASNQEAVAILARLPLEFPEECLDLPGQNRVAQRVIIRHGRQRIGIANSHLYWQPGDSAQRLLQVERLLSWLKSNTGDLPWIVCGDFNAAPDSRAIRRMRQDFYSAYSAVHGSEPDRTYPTPLRRPLLGQVRSLLRLIVYVRPIPFPLRLRSVLDYIFVDPRLQVLDCRRVFDRPAPNNPHLYPSDHYGLMARIATTDQDQQI